MPRWKADLSVAIPIGIALVLLLATLLGIAGPIADEMRFRGAYDTLKDFGWLISAVVATAGIIIASRNVARQMKHSQTALHLDLIKREEDRIERDLPGLVHASRFCSLRVRDFYLMGPGNDYYTMLSAIGLDREPEDLWDKLERELSATDAGTRLRIWNVMILVLDMARNLYNAKLDVQRILPGNIRHLPADERDKLTASRQNFESKVKQAEAQLSLAMEQATKLTTELEIRIARWRRELPLLRQHIEGTFYTSLDI